MGYKIKPVTLEYPLEFLLELALKGDGWARRQLSLNGYTDELLGDAGNEPKQRV